MTTSYKTVSTTHGPEHVVSVSTTQTQTHTPAVAGAPTTYPAATPTATPIHLGAPVPPQPSVAGYPTSYSSVPQAYGATGASYSAPGAGYSAPGAGYPAPGAAYPAPGTGYSAAPGTGYGTTYNTGVPTTDPVHETQIETERRAIARAEHKTLAYEHAQSELHHKQMADSNWAEAKNRDAPTGHRIGAAIDSAIHKVRATGEGLKRKAEAKQS